MKLKQICNNFFQTCVRWVHHSGKFIPLPANVH